MITEIIGTVTVKCDACGCWWNIPFSDHAAAIREVLGSKWITGIIDGQIVEFCADCGKNVKDLLG